jgi:hypothetical protein
MGRLPLANRLCSEVKRGLFTGPTACGIILLILTLATPASAQPEPGTGEEHEREELGVNRYTAPRIEKVFTQLDQLKPLPFAQLWRPYPGSSAGGREQKGMIFGSLVADGFLIVTAEKQNLIDELGRVLLKEARGLGVGDRVMRHSASLTELGRSGNWTAVRKELITTQSDVERAMINLRDEKMAALISLGGWLRGLEMGSAAVTAEFSPERARILGQPELIDYFTEELDTLPPTVAHTPLFDKLRAGVKEVRETVGRAEERGLTPDEVQSIYEKARELNLAVRAAK